MRVHRQVETSDGLVVLADATVSLPARPDCAALLTSLRRLSSTGAAFFLDAEDASSLRLALHVDETADDLPAYRYHRLGGSFHLSVPSGRLCVCGAPAIEIAPGDYALSVRGTVVEEMDAQAYEADRRTALSPADWQFRKRVEQVGLYLGCLPWLVATIVVLIYEFSAVSAYAVGAATVLAAPGYVASRSRRWRSTEERLREFEESYPHYVLELRRVTSIEGLVGGHLNV